MSQAPACGARVRRDFLLSHLRRHRRVLAGAAAVLGLDAVIGVLLPLPLRFIIDEILLAKPGRVLPASAARMLAGMPPEALLLAAAAAMALVYAASVWVTRAQTVWIQRCCNAFVQGVRDELAALYLSRRHGFVAFRSKADLVARASQDTAALEKLLVTGLPFFLRALPSLALIMGMLLWTDVRLAAAMAAAMAAAYWPMAVYARGMRRHRALVRSEETRFEALLLQALQGFSLVKSLSLEPRWRRALAGAAAGVSAHALDMSRAEGGLSAASQGAKLGMRFVIVAVGGWAALRGHLSVGALVMALSYADSVAGAISDFAKFAVKATSSLVGVDRLAELLEASGGAGEDGRGAELRPDAVPSLTLRGVRTGPPGGPELHAALAPGQCVAISGPSGSGKTSLLRLLNRLEEPVSGELLLAGRALREYSLASLRSFVTFVPQDIALFPGSVRENLLLDGAAAEAELWEALERAGARAFVELLPGGLDAEIGESAQSLSTGQSRQLCLARAFLRPARGVFAFDEPCANLDAAASRALLRSFRALAARGALVLWSAHSEEAARAADRVLRLGAQEPSEDSISSRERRAPSMSIENAG